MTVKEVMARLESMGDEKLKKINLRNGATENQFGVKMGDLRNLAKEIKLNPELAKQLWETGHWEAQLLATQLMKPKELSADELEAMVASVPFSETVIFSQLADWLVSYVVKQHPQKEELRQRWMASDHRMLVRAGWSLTAERIAKSPDGLDVVGLLDRIEREMGSVPPMSQWPMNHCLAEIGINFPELRPRAIAIAEKIGAFKDYPVSKGCTSPFAPIWIGEMVKRQG